MTIVARARKLAVTALLLSCGTKTTPDTTPGDARDAEAPPADDGGDAAVEADADAGMNRPDCALADDDRTDAGFPLMTVDRTKVGKVCFTLEAGTVAICGAGEGCDFYRLEEDPPGTARCGLGCGAVTCPGEWACNTYFSNVGQPFCKCE